MNNIVLANAYEINLVDNHFY